MKAKDIYMYILGAIVVVGFFGVVIFKLIADKDAQLEIGSLIGAFGLVVGYFFGSSKGSADKNYLFTKNNQNEANTPDPGN